MDLPKRTVPELLHDIGLGFARVGENEEAARARADPRCMMGARAFMTGVRKNVAELDALLGPFASPGAPEPSCETCRFWLAPTTARATVRGTCRRRAPLAADGYAGIVPGACADDWCGEHEARP